MLKLLAETCVQQHCESIFSAGIAPCNIVGFVKLFRTSVARQVSRKVELLSTSAMARKGRSSGKTRVSLCSTTSWNLYFSPGGQPPHGVKSVPFIKLSISSLTFHTAKHHLWRTTSRKIIWKAFWETTFFSISCWPDGMMFLFQWHELPSSGMMYIVPTNSLRSNHTNLDSIMQMWFSGRMMRCNYMKPNPMT